MNKFLTLICVQFAFIPNLMAEVTDEFTAQLAEPVEQGAKPVGNLSHQFTIVRDGKAISVNIDDEANYARGTGPYKGSGEAVVTSEKVLLITFATDNVELTEEQKLGLIRDGRQFCQNNLPKYRAINGSAALLAEGYIMEHNFEIPLTSINIVNPDRVSMRCILSSKAKKAIHYKPTN